MAQVTSTRRANRTVAKALAKALAKIGNKIGANTPITPARKSPKLAPMPIAGAMRPCFEPIDIDTSRRCAEYTARVLGPTRVERSCPPRRQQEWRLRRGQPAWRRPCSRSRSLARSGMASRETEAHAWQEVVIVVVPEHVGRHEQDHCQNCADEGIAHQGVADQRSHEYHGCQEAKRLQGQGCQVGH